MRPLRSPIALLLAVVLLSFGWGAPVAEARRSGGVPVVTPRPVVLGSDAASCDNVCNYRALPDPEDPKTSTTNTAKGVRVILTGVFSGMKQWKTPSVKVIGGLGVGVMSGIAGLGKANSQWETYKLEKYIQQSTDYLVCKMDAMVKDLNTAADQRMNDQNLYSFNNGLQAIIEAFYESCGAMNCLNYTNLPPSQRSAFDLDCAVDKGPSSSCPKRGTFNPKKPKYCKFDEGGVQYTGLCDPTNGRCYDVYKYDMAVATMRRIVDLFASKDTVNNFNALNQFYDTEATVALAKGALAKMLMLQQVIMLSGTGGDNGQLLQFVDDMADKLEARYNATLDPARLFKVVNALSRPNTDHDSYSPETVVWPFAREFLDNCDCVWKYQESKWYYKQLVRDNDRVAIKAQIRKSCIGEAKIVESKCNPVKLYFQECGLWSVRDWSSKSCTDYKANYCPGARDRCVEVDNDKGDWSDFVGPFADLQQWRAKLARDRCPEVVTSVNASIWEGAYSLADDLRIELEDIKEAISDMRNIVRIGGMPKASFGVLRGFYPLLAGRCAPRNWNLTVTGTGGVRGVGDREGSWLGRRCPENCLRCKPSWRCLQCRVGHRLAPDGLSCIKA